MTKVADLIAATRAALAAAPLGTDGKLIRRLSAVLLAIGADAGGPAAAVGAGAMMRATAWTRRHPMDGC